MWILHFVYSCKTFAVVGCDALPVTGNLRMGYLTALFKIMLNPNCSVNPFLDKRYTKTDDKKQYLIEISVYIAGKQFRLSMRLYATQADFDKAVGGKSCGDSVGVLRTKIYLNLANGRHILDTVPNITKEKFTMLYKGKAEAKVEVKVEPKPFDKADTDLYTFFDEREEVFLEDERYKTGRNTMSAGNSIKSFRPLVSIGEVDEKFILDYKAWMKTKGNSNATTGIYLRELRAILNKAIKDGIIDKGKYAFKNVPIGSSGKSKGVLYPPQIKAFWEYEAVTLRERRAKALFFFCYLCNGMNFKDAAYLKFRNIKGNTLTFVREKTKRTNKIEDKEINVYMLPEVRKVIEDWGIKDGKQDDYIFDIVKPNLNGIENEKRRDHFQNNHNKILKGIGIKLGFDVSLVFKLSRSSFATMLKLKKTPVSFISDAMGHASQLTTAHYLASIQDDNLKEMSESLLQF